MARFATGVTVITTSDRGGRPFGTTANSVASVSLHPPLVLACLRRESETLAALLERRRFAINVLHSSQRELSDRFGRPAATDSWDAVAHRSSREVPLLEGAIATLECELHDVAEGGDHSVVIGHVVELDHEAVPEADPLLFYAGSYRSLGAAQAPPGSVGSVGSVPAAAPTEVALPSRHGPLRMLSLSDDDRDTSVAALTGRPRGRSGVLVYPHVACTLGDALGSMACPGHGRLERALSTMRDEGHGVAVYHRDRVAGVGLCCAPETGHDGSGGAAGGPPLSDGAVAAVARAAALLELRAVRLIARTADGQRAARAGVPIAEVIEPAPNLRVA
jgi:3-hydroxy-9,10-secoandrosta-1,3,5(10)-triene-9,17-dione monooxygenase reductase component